MCLNRLSDVLDLKRIFKQQSEPKSRFVNTLYVCISGQGNGSVAVVYAHNWNDSAYNDNKWMLGVPKTV